MANGLGFTLVGEDIEGTQADLTEAGAGTLIAVEQDLFHEGGAAFERAGRAGRLHGTATLTDSDVLVCLLVFSFAGDSGADAEDATPGGDTIVAAGALPREGDSYGGGALAITGGSGKFAGTSGTVTVATRNPKRYSF